MALTVRQLLAGLPDIDIRGDAATVISDITADSRRAGPGMLFVAVRGTGGDGHRFLDAALAAGCAAVALEAGRLRDMAPLETGFSGAVIVVPATRPLPAILSRRLYGEPDRSLWTAAVTGTNGKTTVSYLLKEMLDRLHGPCGLLGTIRYDDGVTAQVAPLTTPGGPVFFRWLGRMRDNGCASVAMELSSHGLDQDRTAGLGLDVAVMTNLGRDHLDYHRDTTAYLRAKARILDLLRCSPESGVSGRPGTAVINADDPHLAGLDTGPHPVLRFSARPSARRADVDLQVTSATLALNGTSLEFDLRGRTLAVESPLVGRFNVENLAASLAAGVALGLEPDACAAALGGVPQVPGRLERFILPAGGLAVVDYAHTHDALAAVLGACRELTAGRLLTVFGCGGDRDRGKRPLMGQVAAAGSDLVWVTADNPRSEDPAAICNDILVGYDAVTAPRARRRFVELDRAAAIGMALEEAGRGDIVIVAGKGHEDYQLVGDQVLDLDDRAVITAWIGRQA